MSKINLQDTLSGYNLSIINNNFDAIADQLNNDVLYRNNPAGEPNQMFNDLDMNGNHIFNLPAPINPNDAARLQDVRDAISGNLSATLVPFTPYNNITATNVQTAIQQLDDLLSGSSGAVNTIAALKNLDHTKVNTASVLGYYTKGDGGGGSFWYDASDNTSVDNGGTVIVALDGGRWKRIHNGSVTSRQFGCRGNGTSDDYTFLANGIADTSIREFVIVDMCATATGFTTIPNGKKIRGLNRETCGLVALTANMTFFTKAAIANFVDGRNKFESLQFNANITGVYAFKFTYMFRMDIVDCKFVGMAGAVYADRGYYLNIDRCHVEPGIGVRTGGYTFTSATDTEYIFFVNVRGCTHFNNGNGITVGSAYFNFRRAIDSSVSDCQSFALTNGTDAAYYAIVENDCQNVRFVNCCNENATSSVIIRTGTGVNVQPSFTKFIHCDFDQAYQGHIIHSSGIGTQFIGGSLTSSGIGLNFNAVFVTGGDSVKFLGTTVHGYTSGTTGGAFSLANASNVMIANCQINLCYNGVTHGGGCTGLRVINNVYENGTGGSALNGSFSGVGNRVAGNTGFASPGNLGIGVPSSGVPITNTTGFDATIYVNGGTITATSVNNVLTGGLAGMYPFRVGDTFQVNYSSVPTAFAVIGGS